MSPEECIAALDGALEVAGEDVVLRRIVGRAPNTVNIDVNIRASVRAYRPEELVGGINQTDNQVTMSPTEIAQRQWPGGELPSATVANPSLPRRNDVMIIDGRKRTVEFVNPVSMGGRLVRIELRVTG